MQWRGAHTVGRLIMGLKMDQVDSGRFLMKTKITFLLTALAIGIGLMARSSVADEAEKANPIQSVEELLLQRRDTLKQLVEVVTRHHQTGDGGIEEVIRAKAQLLDAELELAKDHKGRIAILQQRFELMNHQLSAMQTMWKSGHVSQAEVLSAQAEMLESQITLAREMAENGDQGQ